MRTMRAEDAKDRRGELLLDAQREPVTSGRNGRPVAVLLSPEDNAQIERLTLAGLRAAVVEPDRVVVCHAPEQVDEVASSSDRSMAALDEAAACEAGERARAS